jgi:hypothetical protein
MQLYFPQSISLTGAMDMMNVEQQSRASLVERLEEPTLGGFGGDMMPFLPVSPTPQFSRKVSRRDDLRQRGVRLRRERRTNQQIAVWFKGLGRVKQARQRGAA